MTIRVAPLVSYRQARLIGGAVATVGWTLVTVLEPTAWPLILASVIFTGVTWSNLRFGVPTPDLLVVGDAVVVRPRVDRAP